MLKYTVHVTNSNSSATFIVAEEHRPASVVLVVGFLHPEEYFDSSPPQYLLHSIIPSPVQKTVQHTVFKNV